MQDYYIKFPFVNFNNLYFHNLGKLCKREGSRVEERGRASKEREKGIKNKEIKKCLDKEGRMWYNVSVQKGKAQLGDVCDRRQWRRKRAKRSGSDLPIGELFCNEDRGLVTTGRARGAHKQIEYRGVAQLGDVCDRRRWRRKGAKRSGSDLPIGELPKQRRQRLSHNRESAWRSQTN